jgi:calpain-7
LLKKYRLQLQSAASKDEALTLAIGAAENLMSALKLSSDPNEKRQLKAQCSDIMTAAGRIKNDVNWRPTVETAHTTSQRVNVSQWVTEIASVESTTPGFADTASQSSLSRRGLSSTTGPVSNASGPSGKNSIFPFSSSGPGRSTGVPVCDEGVQCHPPPLLIELSDDHFSSLSDHRSMAPTDPRHEARLEAVHRSNTDAHVSPGVVVNSSSLSASEPSLGAVTHEGSASLAPATASYSQIRRLPEPFSTRKRSKREDIILLKASMVNGFKCPPWDKSPAASEFSTQQSHELFT